jgi:hypothetical protein
MTIVKSPEQIAREAGWDSEEDRIFRVRDNETQSALSWHEAASLVAKDSELQTNEMRAFYADQARIELEKYCADNGASILERGDWEAWGKWEWGQQCEVVLQRSDGLQDTRRFSVFVHDDGHLSSSIDSPLEADKWQVVEGGTSLYPLAISNGRQEIVHFHAWDLGRDKKASAIVTLHNCREARDAGERDELFQSVWILPKGPWSVRPRLRLSPVAVVGFDGDGRTAVVTFDSLEPEAESTARELVALHTEAERKVEERMHQALKDAWQYVNRPFVSEYAKKEVGHFAEAEAVVGQRIDMLFALQRAWTFVHGSGEQKLKDEVGFLLGHGQGIWAMPKVSSADARIPVASDAPSL